MDTFVTFFILSTTKLFSVSFNLLIPTSLYDVNGNIIGVYLYYNPNLEYMKGKHLPYALLALTVLGLFIVLRFILLVFSSSSRVRNCSRQCRVRILKEFLHAFHQYYKDSTSSTADCCWYAAYYILVNLGLYILGSFTLSGLFYILAIMYFIIIAILVLLVEPYKRGLCLLQYSGLCAIFVAISLHLLNDVYWTISEGVHLLCLLCKYRNGYSTTYTLQHFSYIILYVV